MTTPSDDLVAPMQPDAWHGFVRGTVHIPDGFGLTAPTWDENEARPAKRRRVLETSAFAAQGLDMLGRLRRGECDEVLLIEDGMVVACIVPP